MRHYLKKNSTIFSIRALKIFQIKNSSVRIKVILPDYRESKYELYCFLC